MLTHLRQRVERTLAETHRAMLSTWGPADIQTSEFECEARGMRLYLRIPQSSDHLFNLEHHSTVVLSTPGWQVRGHARLIADADAPAGLALGAGETSRWTTLMEVMPVQVRFEAGVSGDGDTIDIDEVETPVDEEWSPGGA